MLAKVRELYMSPIRTTPEQFVELIRHAIEAYGKIARTAGIQPR